ncbi:hypothetical protein AB4Z29_04875 [Paenibacillus sp. 2TAB23]
MQEPKKEVPHRGQYPFYKLIAIRRLGHFPVDKVYFFNNRRALVQYVVITWNDSASRVSTEAEKRGVRFRIPKVREVVYFWSERKHRRKSDPSWWHVAEGNAANSD